MKYPALQYPHPTVRIFHTDRKSTRLNSSHGYISYAVFCLKKKTDIHDTAVFLLITFHALTRRAATSPTALLGLSLAAAEPPAICSPRHPTTLRHMRTTPTS